MAITASGIGSGLDIDGLVSSLMAVEKRPLTLLAQKEASFQAQLSAYGQLKGVLGALQTATTALGKAETFQGTKVTVPSTAPFTATSKAGAMTGNYEVEVSQLAKNQRISTAATSNYAPAAGEIRITYGTISDDGSAFTADPERTAVLKFAGGGLEDLRDAINADSTLGIKASIVNNGEFKQLVLNGTATGADKAFKIQGSDGLAGLSYEPGQTGDMTSVQQAKSAKLTVDGIAITRSSNTIADVIDGVTLTLTGTSEAGKPSTIGVSADNSGAKTALKSFVDAYNEVMTAIKDLTYYDEKTKEGSTLTGDSTTRSIQTQLRSAVAGSLTALGGISGLAALGISSQGTSADGSIVANGQLTIDDTKLTKALENEDFDFATFFAGTDQKKGFAAQVSEKITSFISTDSITKKETGLLANRTTGIDNSITALLKQYETLETRLETVEARYRKQFTSLDTLISSMTQTSSFLTQQLASLPGSSS